jgi:molybdopterin-binding protein
MNSIDATITAIQAIENLHIVTCKAQDSSLTLLSLDLAPNIHKGSRVKLATKATNIALAHKSNAVNSFENHFEAQVIKIENGKLLSNVTLHTLETELEALITLNAAKRMQLQKNDTVIVLINASDLYIAEVCDD